MTNSLLIIIAVLLLVLLTLRTRNVENVVENRLVFFENRHTNYAEVIQHHNDVGYELRQVVAGVTVDGKDGCLFLFARKRI